jgi:hypothetical protein
LQVVLLHCPTITGTNLSPFIFLLTFSTVSLKCATALIIESLEKDDDRDSHAAHEPYHVSVVTPFIEQYPLGLVHPC